MYIYIYIYNIYIIYIYKINMPEIHPDLRLTGHNFNSHAKTLIEQLSKTIFEKRLLKHLDQRNAKAFAYIN